MHRHVRRARAARFRRAPRPFRRAALPALACAILAVAPARAQDVTTDGAADGAEAAPPTVAREWTEALLFAIRRDLARPTVHARNLYHLSAAMYDAWALHDERAATAFLVDDPSDAACGVTAAERAAIRADSGAVARETAIGHAAWRLLDHRFERSRRGPQLLARFEQVARRLGLERADAAMGEAASPAETVGLRVAGCVIARGARDGSNEAGDHANADYAPVNPPLDPTLPGNPGVADPNRWQPLALETFIDQSGNVTGVPTFLGADWGRVTPFALGPEERSEAVIDGVTVPVWLDPGPPPILGDDPAENATWQSGHALVVQWSAMLDPSDGVPIDISPGAIGELGPLDGLPDDQAGILAAYDGVEGGIRNGLGTSGHAVNPATGEPYASNVVPRGDYTRVLAEFWADGPDSETPPGHWFSVYNEAVVGHPLHDTRLGGVGEPLDPLEYDLHAYLALGGALHDGAIAAWSVKRAHDSMRPIGAIRYMAALGQSTDATAANYHVHGVPLVDGMIETVPPGDPLAGANGENVGRIKARAWRGPDAVDDPDRDVAGVGWILLETWWPYQRPSFVTPPFAGYVSGHSTFSRAAAEVLTLLTGDPFFPGGLAEFVAPANEFLVFERGPSVDVRLQWATYRDAADQTSLSRIWGGIHPPADDIVGRRMGEVAGRLAWERALGLFAGQGAGAAGGTDAAPGGDGVAEDGAGGVVVDGPSGTPGDVVGGGGGGDGGGGGGCSIAGPGTDRGLAALAVLAALCAARRRRHERARTG